MHDTFYATLLGLFAASMLACAPLEQARRDRICNRHGAYANGMNQARAGEPMNPGMFESCSSERRDELLRQYRSGYRDGATRSPRRRTVDRRRECVDAYGERECGYSCAEGYGEVECTDIPGGNCVTAYGDVRCGRNCRAEYGEIVCN